jgi:hypothetical protein
VRVDAGRASRRLPRLRHRPGEAWPIADRRCRPHIRLTQYVCFFGVVDLSLHEAVELFVRREDAERMLDELLRDEPQWAGLFRIERIELGGISPN